jgi:hypothetical protein
MSSGINLPRVRRLLTSPVGEAQPWDRWDHATLAAGAIVGSTLYAILYWQFVTLSFTGDLFVNVQLARSWLEGRFLEDNCFGNHLVFHTYFFTLALGILAKPFGVPGLFAALGLAVGASLFLSARILRLLGVSGQLALPLATLLIAAPISVGAFHEAGGFGFHAELILPALVLGLFYQLLLRRKLGAAIMTVLVCSVKEDAPIAAISAALIVLLEDRLTRREKLHRPALLSLGLATALLPLLMLVGQLQTRTVYAVNRFTLLESATAGQIHGFSSLMVFVAAHFSQWLQFGKEQQFLRLFACATFGMIWLRPYLLPFVFLTTAVAWVLNQGLLWSPRFVNTLSSVWCVTLLGLAALVRVTGDLPRRWRWTVAVLSAVLVVYSIHEQLQFSFWARDTYALVPRSHYTAAERLQADELFQRYRQMSKRDEPVVASPFLFRYAHDRNLFWMDRLVNRPTPVWILGDGEWQYTDFGLAGADYDLIQRLGRFTLRKRKAGSH